MGGGWDTNGVIIKVSSESDPSFAYEITARIFDYFVDLSSHPHSEELQRNRSVQLGYTVYGVGGPSEFLPGIRYVIDNLEAEPTDTQISENGLLTVGANEQAERLNVYASFEDEYTGFTPEGKTYYSRSAEFIITGDGTPPSNDATLSTLSISAGTLTPAFHPNITSYTATVPYSVSSIDIAAAATDQIASVSGAGANALTVGANTLNVFVDAEDGTSKIYTITVTREAPPATGDHALDLGALTEDINVANWSYFHTSRTVSIKGDVVVTGTRPDGDSTLHFDIPEKLTVLWQAQYSGNTSQGSALLDVRGSGKLDVANGGSITQTGTGNAINILCNAAEGELSFLGKLEVSGGEVSARSGHAIFRQYQDIGGGSIGEILISGGTVKRTGGDSSGAAISVGAAVLYVEGGEIASNGWCIDARRSKSILITGGTIKSDASAIRGNTIFDKLRMSDGSVEAKDDAISICANVTIEGGALSAGARAIYIDESLERNDVTCAYLTGTIARGSVVSDSAGYATIVEVDTLAIPGSYHGLSTGITRLCGKADVTWDLKHFLDTFNEPAIRFKPSDSADVWIGWGYYANSSPDATLLALSISAGTLAPAFDSETTGYTATVPNSVSSIDITARASDPKASVSGAGTKALAVGQNSLDIVVTAEGGTTVKTYTIVITRESSTVNHKPIDPPAGPIRPGSNAVVSFAGEFAQRTEIKLNGQILTQTPNGASVNLSGYGNYSGVLGTAESGSVRVTLNKEFLQTLPSGIYTLNVGFADGGSGSAPIEIKNTPVISKNGGSNSDSDSGGSPGTSSTTGTLTSALTVDAAKAKAAALSAQSSGRGKARITHTGEIKVDAAAWAAFGGMGVDFDTVEGGAVQVRVTVKEPGRMTKEMLLSGEVKGSTVNARRAFFEKWFKNRVRIIHLEQSGSFGQAVEIAARVDLTGMDPDDLVFYSYDKTANTYRRIEKPAYWIDKNGYLRFTTECGGDIIISEGELQRI